MRSAIIIASLALVLVLASAVTAYAAAGTADVKYPDWAKVSIQNGAFTPDNVTIAKGGYVIWTNMDNNPNSVKFDSYEKNLGKGGALTRTYENPGTYTYSNGLSPKHKGIVIVK